MTRLSSLTAGHAKTVSSISSFALIAGIVLSRSVHAIHHLPPDPSLGFQLPPGPNPLSGVLSNHDGYLQVAPRLLSLLLDLPPLSQLTYWMTITNAIAVSLCALAIGRAAHFLAGTRIAIVSALGLACNYAAHEGLIGNIWAIRWPLLAAACAVVASGDFQKLHPFFTAAILLSAGLSHAYIVIPTGILLTSLATRRKVERYEQAPLCILLGSSALQLISYIESGTAFQKYGDDTYFWPWSNAGLFWWGVFVGPLALALSGLIPIWLSKWSSGSIDRASLLVVVQSIVLSGLSYAQLGVKTSPAVASASVGLFALSVSAARSKSRAKFQAVARALLVSGVLAFAALSARGFFASYFLTSGDNWLKVVQVAESKCIQRPTGIIELPFFVYGDGTTATEELTCRELLQWNKWFWQRG